MFEPTVMRGIEPRELFVRDFESSDQERVLWPSRPGGNIRHLYKLCIGTTRWSVELAEQILAETHVVTEAGSFYGPAGEGHLRICFGAESFERVTEAMDRLAKFFNR